MSEIFRCHELNFSYDHEIDILKNVNLTVKCGESLSILGANGCGKSTLLKIMAGLIFPTSGDFHAFGEKIDSERMKHDSYAMNYHRKIGFIFQDSDVQLFCNNVRDELAFGLLQLNFAKDEIEKRIYDISRLLNIESLLTKTPFKLSGGEKKKVAIASVLLLNPQVLIFDEPTNALDPKTQYWLIQLLQQLTKAGKTLIITTHNLDLVSEITQRGILFNEQHEIVCDDLVEKILANKKLLKEVNLIY